MAAPRAGRGAGAGAYRADAPGRGCCVHLRREAEVGDAPGRGRSAGARAEPAAAARPARARRPLDDASGRTSTTTTSRAVSVEEAAAPAAAGPRRAGRLRRRAAARGAGAREVPRIMAMLGATGRSAQADAEALRRTWARVAPHWRRSARCQPLHGDAHIGNMLVPRGGEPLWSDFEDACAGRSRGTWPACGSTRAPSATRRSRPTAQRSTIASSSCASRPAGCSPRHGRASRRSGGLSSRSGPRRASRPTGR